MSKRENVARAMSRLLEAGGSAARSITTRVGGADFHYLEEGAGEGVLVLLHGGSGGGANWFRLLEPLSARFRVLAPDLPGFGLSAPVPPEPPMGRHAAALLDEWLAGIGVSRAVVVGTSFGGLAALRLAQLRPARVTHLFLLNSAGLGASIHPLVRLAALRLLTRVSVRPSRRGTTALFRILLTADRSELPPSLTGPLLDYLHASAVAAGTAYLAQTLQHFVGPRGQREVLSAAELRALTLPVTVAWGERDPFLRMNDGRRAAALLPDATFVAVERAGHSPNWERPQAVLRAISALAARPAK